MVMPVNDEQDNIEFVVNSALEILPKITNRFEIILVDDGSTDLTPIIIDQLVAANKEIIKVVHHARKKGYGAALVSGIEISKFNLILVMDSDRQYDINDIKKLIPHVEKYDIVTGYRLIRSDSVHRILLGRLYNLVVNLVLGMRTKDVNCGLKLFKKSIFKEMKIKSRGALFYAEILSKNKNFKEVRISHFPRICGYQKVIKPKAIITAIIELFNVWRSKNSS